MSKGQGCAEFAESCVTAVGPNGPGLRILDRALTAPPLLFRLALSISSPPPAMGSLCPRFESADADCQEWRSIQIMLSPLQLSLRQCPEREVTSIIQCEGRAVQALLHTVQQTARKQNG